MDALARTKPVEKTVAFAGAERNTILLACADPRPFKRILPVLTHNYYIKHIDQGYAALNFLKKSNNSVKAAIIDTDLPGITGFQIAKRRQEFRCAQDQAHVPVMLVGKAEKDRDAAGRFAQYSDGLAFVPFNDGAFLNRFWHLCDRVSERSWVNLNHIQAGVLKIAKRNLEKIFDISVTDKNYKMKLVKQCSNVVVDAALSSNLKGALKALENHHSYIFVHTLKVASLMSIFGNNLGIKRRDLLTMAQAGLLHDIGKSRTPVGLLDKPDQLAPGEWEVMKRHVVDYGDIMRVDGGVPQEIMNVVERHHEKIDGTGYPRGLKGAQLDDLSLVTAIIDIYSALTDKRSYKPAINMDAVVKTMRSMRGSHLEPCFLDKFLLMLHDGVLH